MKSVCLFLFIASLILFTRSIEITTQNQFEYDLNQSKQFQKYCVLTHCSQDIIINWNCKICPNTTALQQSQYIINSLTNVVVFVGYHAKLNSIVMAFRGTQDAKNWLEDFSYLQVAYERCKSCMVHEGFYLDLLSVIGQLKSYVQRIRVKYPGCGIYAIGSSMGGALATIAALQMQLMYGNVKQLHVFGCPRVGDRNFVQFLTQKISKIRRIIHNKDIVPHVPFLSQNYVHAAYELWFDENMQKYKVCNSSGQDPSCSDSLNPNYSIQDHITYWVKPIASQIC